MIKITKKLIKEIIKIDKPTSQDIDILGKYIANLLQKRQNFTKLDYQALSRYNQLNIGA